jgi:hypothetical protein
MVWRPSFIPADCRPLRLILLPSQAILPVSGRPGYVANGARRRDYHPPTRRNTTRRRVRIVIGPPFA